MNLVVLVFYHRYVILTGQSNLSINFRVRLIMGRQAQEGKMFTDLTDVVRLSRSSKSR